MSNEQQDDWVQARTPGEGDFGDENVDEDSEYGQAFEPEEWDDYTSEQSAPVAPPQPRPAPQPSEDVAAATEGEVLTAEEAEAVQPELSDEQPVAQPIADYDAAGYGGGQDEPVPPADASGEVPNDVPADVWAEDDVDATTARTSADQEPDKQPEPVAAEEPEAQAKAAAEPEPELETVEPTVTEDLEQTRVVPVADLPDAAAVAGAGAGAAASDDVMDDLYRPAGTASPARTEDDDQTQVLQPPVEPHAVDAHEVEERRIQEQLAAERQARRERLGVVETSDDNAVRSSQAKPPRTTDKFAGAFPLFILRLITAAVVGITGYQMLTPVEDTAAVLETTILPEPQLMAWILGFTLAGLAIFLVLGLLQRVVGLLLMVYSIGMLVILRWGDFNPFRELFEGFMGDKELLLAGIGFLLLMVGGGRWGIDGAFRASRAKAKAERQA